MKRRTLLQILGFGSVIAAGTGCKSVPVEHEVIPKLPSDVHSEPVLVDTLIEIGNGLQTNPELTKHVQDILRKSQLT